MANRLQRLQSLQSDVKKYVSEEKKRLENEVSVLEAILNGRTGGKGIQQIAIGEFTQRAEHDLYSYLMGD